MTAVVAAARVRRATRSPASTTCGGCSPTATGSRSSRVRCSTAQALLQSSRRPARHRRSAGRSRRSRCSTRRCTRRCVRRCSGRSDRARSRRSSRPVRAARAGAARRAGRPRRRSTCATTTRRRWPRRSRRCSWGSRSRTPSCSWRGSTRSWRASPTSPGSARPGQAAHVELHEYLVELVAERRATRRGRRPARSRSTTCATYAGAHGPLDDCEIAVQLVDAVHRWFGDAAQDRRRWLLRALARAGAARRAGRAIRRRGRRRVRGDAAPPAAAAVRRAHARSSTPRSRAWRCAPVSASCCC